MIRRALLFALAILGALWFDLAVLDHALLDKIPNPTPDDDLWQLLEGSRRMIESGTPYIAAYRTPGVDLPPGWEIGNSYVYPPLVASLLIPLAGLAHGDAWRLFTLLEIGALIGTGLLAARAAGVRCSVGGVLLASLLLVAANPIASALWYGRTEPFIALAIGVLVLGLRTRAGMLLGALAGAASFLLRPPSSGFLVVFAARRRALLALGAAGLALVGVAALVAPLAWADYLGGVGVRTIGANLTIGLYDDTPHAVVGLIAMLATGVTPSYDSRADLAALGPAIGALVTFVRLLEIAGAVALGLWAIRLARDSARRHTALAAGIVGGILLSGLYWGYHLLPILAPAIATYLVAPRRLRLLLLGAYGLTLLPTIGLHLYDFSTGMDPAWELRLRALTAVSGLPVGLLIIEAARRTRLTVPA